MTMIAELPFPITEDILADALQIAVLLRLAATPAQPAPPAGGALSGWRLRRVLRHIDAHLADPVTLNDMARAAGLSRMHFAAGFRAATGLRPHDFLLRRRIERACEMLADDRAALAQVALDVGFQTQAHFTTVFKRIRGETPHRWRCRQRHLHDEGAAPAA